MLRQQFSCYLATFFDKAVFAVESLIDRIGDVNGSAANKQALTYSNERIEALSLDVERLESLLSEFLDSNSDLPVLPDFENLQRRDTGCTCGHTFRTAEDYRDHLPCEPVRKSMALLSNIERVALEKAICMMSNQLLADGKPSDSSQERVEILRNLIVRGTLGPF